MEDNSSFAKWLEKILLEKEMSQSELARKAGVTRGAINGILTGARGPGNDLCLAIAHALGFPPEFIFRKAGLLPPESKESEFRKLISFLADQLPTQEDKDDAVEYIRLRLRIAEERGKYENVNKKRPSKTG